MLEPKARVKSGRWPTFVRVRMVKIEDDGKESALIFGRLTSRFPSESTRASCLTWPALLCALLHIH